MLNSLNSPEISRLGSAYRAAVQRSADTLLALNAPDCVGEKVSGAMAAHSEASHEMHQAERDLLAAFTGGRVYAEMRDGTRVPIN